MSCRCRVPTALIVGLGGIGAETARLLAAFGVQVLAVDARRTDKPDAVAELHQPEALDALLPRADFVILTVPHTPATEGFFNAPKFRLMKRQRVLHQHRPRHDDKAGRSGGGSESRDRSPARRWMSTSRNRCRRTIRCGACRTFC